MISSPPQGWGCDAQWSDDFHHALHAIVTGEKSGYYEDFGTVAQLAFSLVGSSAEDADDALERHRELIGKIRDSWPEAGKAAENYARETASPCWFVHGLFA